MGDDVVMENDTQTNVSLDFEIANGIRHTVATLDESNSGEVAKSQLQAVVANVCQAIKTPFVSEDLENFLPDKENLTVVEFLDFLETTLLVKGKKLNQKVMDELLWVVVGQKYDDDPHLLTKKDAFKLWLSFKKLDISGELKVDVEELCIVLEKFVRGIGVQWNEQVLNEYTEDGAVFFWKFIDCLERKFLIGVDKSVLREGLQDLFDVILDEVTKTGFLSKKGHSMLKSQKSRWFVLKPERLTYYVTSGYREKKGEIILNNEAKVTSIPDKGSNKCRFQVTCGKTKKDYEQTAQDQRTKQAWITAVQTAIECYGGETPFIRDLKSRKAKRDADKARKLEEEKRRKEQEDLLSQQRQEIDLLKKRKEEIEKYADEEKAMLDAEIRRREELEELQRNLQQLLEDQKKAREEEEKVRAAKERLLEEERKKREELEALRMLQQQELQEEKIQKEELMERQKEQERILEEERKRLRHLEEERMKAEEAAKIAHDKLSAAESAAKNAAEAAKDRVRQLKTSIGLKGTVGPKVDPLVTHRGKGAFTLEEFLNRATDWSGLSLEEEDKHKASVQQRRVLTEDELVKANATPASNQNIPEFLKKAAAWSGLNPDTYLETSEGTKSGSPPKVAAKPPKPVKTEVADKNVKMVNGACEDSEGPQVEEGEEGGSKTEEAKGVEVTNDVGSPVEEGKEESQGKEREDMGPQEEVMADEGSKEEAVDAGGDERSDLEVAKDRGSTENDAKVESEVVDGKSEGPEVVEENGEGSEVKSEGSEVIDVKSEGSQVVEEKGEGSDVVETKGEGSEVVEEKSEGSLVVEEKGEGSEVVEVKSEGSEVVEEKGEGSEVVEEKSEGSEVVEEKGEGSEVVEEKGEGSVVVEEKGEGSEVVEGKSEGSEVVEEKCEGSEVVEVKSEGSEVVEETCEGSEVVEEKSEESEVPGVAEGKDVGSQVDGPVETKEEEKDLESNTADGESEEPVVPKVENTCPEVCKDNESKAENELSSPSIETQPSESKTTTSNEENTEAVSENTETVSDNTKAVSKHSEAASENTEAVSENEAKPSEEASGEAPAEDNGSEKTEPQTGDQVEEGTN